MNIELHIAQQQLPSLLARALSGEEVVISDAQKHMVRLVPYTQPTRERKSGQWRGKATITDDFDTLPEAMLQTFLPK